MAEERISLDTIAENNEIVLLDQNVLQTESEGSLPTKLYECHEEFFVDIKQIDKNVRFAHQWISAFYRFENLLTIPEVLEESIEYLRILNSQIKYHKNNLLKRRSGKRVLLYSESDSHRMIPEQAVYERALERRRTNRKIVFKGKLSRKGKKYAYKPFDKGESYDLESLRVYANQIFEINRIMKNRIVEIEDEQSLEKVIDMVEQIGIKNQSMTCWREYRERPKSKARKIIRYTDERLAYTSAELAAKGRTVALLSNDRDHVWEILNAIYQRRMFPVPENGCVKLYSNFRHDDFEMKFDSNSLKINNN